MANVRRSDGSIGSIGAAILRSDIYFTDGEMTFFDNPSCLLRLLGITTRQQFCGDISTLFQSQCQTRISLLENADAGQQTNDGKDGQQWKRRTNDGKDGQTKEKMDKRWKRRTNDGKDGQTMEKTDKRWKRRTNEGKDGQTMKKTDKRWKRRTNDGKGGQTMEKAEKRSKRRTNDGKDGRVF